MRIVICGSMTFSKKMVEIEKELVKNGNVVILPKFTKEYVKLDSIEDMHSESKKNKIEHDLIRDYFNEIKNADAVLVVNKKRHNIDNYLGGNSLIEMSFAHVLNKKIFLLNPIPDVTYKDEIEAMQPTILAGNLSKIK